MPLKSEESTITGYLAVSAFKHHLISKEHPKAQLKPLLRWYNGQLAKEFIKKYYKEAKETLECFCAIGLLNVKAGQYNGLNEYHLDQFVKEEYQELSRGRQNKTPGYRVRKLIFLPDTFLPIEINELDTVLNQYT